jgi:uncharacterized protein with ParB-like and HNH nuclease domain
MSKLNIDQKCIKDLFEDKKADFLIPDYQRPYAWGRSECETLWEDIFAFAIPDGDYSKFNSDKDEYYFGSIVTFNNTNNKKEIIDGQQRLTTLMLLLRAFYNRLGKMKDEETITTRDTIARCIWKTDEFGKPNVNHLKLDSEVASDDHKQEFLQILKTGLYTKAMKSKYAENFNFFEEKINEFSNSYPTYFAYLPNRILKNCILLPIEAESQDAALRIFSTLNDRGKPLSDADIFKADLYKFYSSINKKESFIKRWKDLETLCQEIFSSENGTPLDEIFTRYMYFERAKKGIKSSTTEALRKFYKQISPNLLKTEDTFENLIVLADFWKSIVDQDDDKFSKEVLNRLFTLHYSPNGMWTYFLSVYFMANKDTQNNLSEPKFLEFLNKTIAFTFSYAFTNPGVNALRTPLYSEMINIVNGKEVTFDEFRLDEESVINSLSNYAFLNSRPITKSLLTWWAFRDNNQELLDIDQAIEIEHIYPKVRFEKEPTLSDMKYLESLGNKSLLEKRINIRASDFRLSDKIKYYVGYTNKRGEVRKGTKFSELLTLKDKTDFSETEIIKREKDIFSEFVKYLKDKKVLKV